MAKGDTYWKMLMKIINSAFEFQVTFPNNENIPDVRVDVSSVSQQFAELNTIKKSKTPVIFILGWLGATDRYLLKYSTIYDNLGFITIRYVLPVYKLFLVPNWTIPPVVKNLLGLLKDFQLSGHPVVFHVLSNNGAWLYYYISEALQTAEYKDILVKGCIFDSCPSPRSIRSAYKATYRALPAPALFRFFGGALIVSYLIFWKGYILLHSLFTLNYFPDVHTLSPYGMVDEPFRWPQLFMYSKMDDVVPYEEVLNFAAQREKLGVIVYKKEFDSPHVQHQRHHPIEYRKTVEDFLGVCLQE